jgi:FkbM family methyltransferase
VDETAMLKKVFGYWRQGQQAEELQANFKSALNERQIRHCYEVVLGRVADEGGLAHYLRVAKAQNFNTLHLLALELFKSDEFQSRFCAGQVDIFTSTKEIEYYGLRLELPENDAVFRAITANGTYEPNVSQHLFSHICRDDVFVDVGANLGVLSLPVAKLVGINGKVLAFEASQQNANLLAKNAVVNKLSNVEVFPIGLADHNGAAISHVFLGTSNKALTDLPSSQLQSGMEVIPVVKLDSFLESDRKIDVVKIDVEGHEYKVIRGALATLSKWRPKIYLEYSDAFQRSGSGVPGSQLLELLVDLNYAPTILHRDLPPQPIGGKKDATVSTLNSAWEQSIREGGTHIDLFWAPLK